MSLTCTQCGYPLEYHARAATESDAVIAYFCHRPRCPAYSFLQIPQQNMPEYKVTVSDSLYTLHLSPRTENALLQHGITSIPELLRVMKQRNLATYVRGLGKKGMAEIWQKISQIEPMEDQHAK